MKTGATIESLQVLRGVAASAVVLHHTIRAVLLFSSGRNADATAIAPWLAEWLAIGVDVFFVISGFIMVYISSPYVQGKKPLYDFAIMRIIRIYPLYLTATLLLLSIQTASFLLSTGTGFNLDFERILSALVLFPSFNQKGLVQPILGVGWTLSYEMLFYIVFYISINLARNINVLITTTAILILINVSASLIPEGNTAIQLFFRDRILFEFIFGCGIATIYMKGLLRQFSVWLFLGLFLTSLALSFVSSARSDYRFFLWGLAAASIVLLLLQIDDRGFRQWPRLLVLIGKASYSIYIFHTLILYFLLVPDISHLHIGSPTSWRMVLMISTIWCILIASTIVIHVIFERPLQAYLIAVYRRAVAGRGARAISAPSKNTNKSAVSAGQDLVL